MDVEREIVDLKRRVNDLEGAMNVLAGGFGQIEPRIEALKSSAVSRFDQVDTALLRVVSRLDTVNEQVWSLRDDMPVLVAQALQRSESGP